LSGKGRCHTPSTRDLPGLSVRFRQMTSIVP
jgi:hypothetical protein